MIALVVLVVCLGLACLWVLSTVALFRWLDEREARRYWAEAARRQQGTHWDHVHWSGFPEEDLG